MNLSICLSVYRHRGLPAGSAVKNLPASAGDAGDAGSAIVLGSSLEGGNGDPCQYSCWENAMNRGAPGVADSRTRLGD